MKLNIDHLNSSSGWVVNSPSSIAEIESKSLVSGLNSKSLMISFNRNDVIKTATKTFATPFDVTEYETLVFSVFSYTKGKSQNYLKPSDFSYKIDIDGIHEFYFPIYENFTDIEIGLEDVTEINQIKITAIHNDTDTIFISEMVAEKEEIEIDMLNSVKEHIDYFVEQIMGKGILLGTLNAIPGDTSLTLANPVFLDRYGVIKIDDGVNSEIHQVEDNDGIIFSLNSEFDGNEILNTFTNANYYLCFPSYINPGQVEIRLPGIAIWGISPEAILRGGKLDTQRDTFEVNGNSKERIEGQILKFNVLITLEARSQELISFMARAVRRFIASESLWINGRRHDIFFTGPATELSPESSAINYLPQIQYSLSVEIKENINDRIEVPVTTTVNITSNIKS